MDASEKYRMIELRPGYRRAAEPLELQDAQGRRVRITRCEVLLDGCWESFYAVEVEQPGQFPSAATGGAF